MPVSGCTQLAGKMRFAAALTVAKISVRILSLIGKNAGQLPGVIAEKIDPSFLTHIDKPSTIVFISGTNGKTTLNNLLNDLLQANNYQLVNNRAGGNIKTGIESAFLKNVSLWGKRRLDTAVLELDELSFRTVMPEVTPSLILVTNLYRDSFSRNANPDFIFKVMRENIPNSARLILNADDLISCRLVPENARAVYFSIGRLPEDTDGPQGLVCDLTACPECGGELKYDYAHLRHLGRARCTACGYTNPQPAYEVVSVDRTAGTFSVCEHNDPSQPIYSYKIDHYSIINLYSLLATTVAAREMGLTPQQIADSLEQGINITHDRYYEENVCGKRLISLASKGENSTATSVALDIIRKEQGKKAVVLMLADAHKAESPVQTEFTGWYYQTDFEYLTDSSIEQVIIQGATSEDLLLRLMLTGIDMNKVCCVSTPKEAAEAINCNLADTIIWAFDIFNGEDVRTSRDYVISRLMEETHDR